MIYKVNIDKALMDGIDEMPSLKQMHRVLNDMIKCKYYASKEAKQPMFIFKIRPN